jgi:hypothetical protein
VNPAISVASTAESLPVFPSVVHPAQWQRIGLIGSAVVGDPFIDVIDIAELGWNITATVAAGDRQQLGCLASLAGEQPLRAPEADDHVVSINHDSPNTPAKHRFDRARCDDCGVWCIASNPRSGGR